MITITDVLDTLEHIITYLDANRNLPLRVALDSNISLTDPNTVLYKFGLVDSKPVSAANIFTDERFIIVAGEVQSFYSYRFVTEYLYSLIEGILIETGYIAKEISGEHLLYILTIEMKDLYIMSEKVRDEEISYESVL